MPQNATHASCPPGWDTLTRSVPSPPGAWHSVQCQTTVSDRWKWSREPQDSKNAKSALALLLASLLGHPTQVLPGPNFVARLPTGPTTDTQIPPAQFQYREKCEIIAQGGVHQNRELVDTKTHASCAARQNRDKQRAFPTT